MANPILVLHKSPAGQAIWENHSLYLSIEGARHRGEEAGARHSMRRTTSWVLYNTAIDSVRFRASPSPPSHGHLLPALLQTLLVPLHREGLNYDTSLGW